MPLTLNVGLSKKIGQPDYGSLGASCNLAVELDANLLTTGLERFPHYNSDPARTMNLGNPRPQPQNHLMYGAAARRLSLQVFPGGFL